MLFFYVRVGDTSLLISLSPMLLLATVCVFTLLQTYIFAPSSSLLLHALAMLIKSSKC